MDATAKLKRLLTEDDDLHWKTEHLTRELSDWENSLRVSWDDQALRSMWSSYIFPRQENAADMLEEHGRQMEATKVLCIKDEEVFEKAVEIGKHSEEIARLMDIVARETEACEMNLDRGTEDYKHSQAVDECAQEYNKKTADMGVHVTALLARRKAVY